MQFKIAQDYNNIPNSNTKSDMFWNLVLNL